MAVLTLPKSLPSAESFDLLVDKYKAFRLLSLKLSPQVFGSTYAREEAFPDDRWISRLSNPLATSIVAVSNTGSATTSSELESNAGHVSVADRILTEEWLGSLTLMGPLDKQHATEMFGDAHLSMETCFDEGAECHFILNAMYVTPSARGSGVGSALILYANQLASKLASGGAARVLLVVDQDNEAARRSYAKGGFVTIHRHWFDDYRVGRSGRTEAAVMKVDLNRD
ncbi:hypothetical protein BGZ63DRAFT_390372 [Mariannaea sp. PMI_226]|nr:hypothetical protein BGZ63DRAFT_390372 [Mariannaea sp. PMI_226]